MTSGNDGRAAPALLAVAALAAVLFAAAAWWYLTTHGPQLEAEPRTVSGASQEPNLPSNVEAEVRELAAGGRANEAGEKSGDALREGAETLAAVPVPSLGDLHGRLVERVTGRPVAGGSIVAIAPDELDESSFWLRLADGKERAVSAADGSFTIVAVAASELLFVRAERFAMSSLDTRLLAPPHAAPTVVPLDFEPRFVALATGPGGVPIVGARVVLRSEQMLLAIGPLRQGQLHFPRFEFEAITGVDGRATIGQLPPYLALHAQLEPPESAVDRAPRVHPVSMRFEPGQEIVREWRLGGGVTLRGVLLDEGGLAVGDVSLWVLRAQKDRRGSMALRIEDELAIAARATTDAAGRFVFEELAPGSWWIGPAPWSRTPVGSANQDLVPHATQVDLREGEVEREVELHAQHGLFIEGRAVDRRGVGVAGVGSIGRGQRSDKEGWFRFGPLGPGNRELRFWPDDERYGPSQPIVVASGERDVRIDVPDAALLDIEAVAPDGRIVPASLVSVAREGGTLDRGKVGVDGRVRIGDQSGRFNRIGSLPAGNYAIGLTTDDGLVGTAADVTVVEGATTRVRVLLMAGGEVELRYENGPSERAMVAFSCNGILVAFLEVVRGATVRCPVVPGMTHVGMTMSSASVKRDVEVAAGERREVVIDETR